MDNINPNGPAGAAQVFVTNHTNKAQPENVSESSAVDKSNSAPTPMCRFFRRGFCRNGAACQFRHLAPSAAKGEVAVTCHSETRVCRFYQRGRCRNGDSCCFRHIKPQGEAQEEEGKDEKENKDTERAEAGAGAEGDTDWLMRLLGYRGEQGSSNWGFTEEEVELLFSYGVKPYESDAENVLAYLNGGWKNDFGDDDSSDYDCDWGLDDDDDDLNLEKLDLDTSSANSRSGFDPDCDANEDLQVSEPGV